jgi:ribosomal protein S1
LSEISDRPISNPAEVLKIGQKVKAKLILLDPK